MRLTQPQLNRWLAKWQPRLKLQDWEIIPVLQTRKQMGNNDGLCDHTLPRRHAIIRVAKNGRNPKSIAPHDPEQILVHEMLHCALAPFESKEADSLADIAQEQVIDMLASELVRLSRLANEE